MTISASPKKLKILLAGFGTMGKIYSEKLIKNAEKWNIELIGLVDTNPKAFELDEEKYQNSRLMEARNIAKYDDIEDALGSTEPDIVINTTNNEGHIEIIRELSKYPQIKGYLTEKPLVGEERDETEAITLLQNKFISMNMVTNFSEAAIGMKEWLAENKDMKLVGVDAVWGKDRTADTRPTPGIVNDIVHPIGLVQSIHGTKSWALDGKAQGEHGLLSTDRNGNQNNCVYHYTVGFNTNVAPVRMDTSFGWKDQARRVTSFLKNSAGQYFAADLFLDAKREGHKDQGDYFQVHALDESFKPIDVVASSDFSTADKVESFLGRSIQSMRGEISPQMAGLVGLDEEKEIGKLYGLLHPASDLADLQKSPDLNIVETEVAASPKEPLFTTIDKADPAEIKLRIQTLEAMKPTAYQPQLRQNFKPF